MIEEDLSPSIIHSLYEDILGKNLTEEQAMMLMSKLTDKLQLERCAPRPSMAPETDDVCSWMQFFLFTALFPPTFLTCMVGNALNVGVCWRTSLRHCLGVRLLSLKAVMNMLFMLCFLMEACDFWQLWSPNSAAGWLYNNSKPYLLSLENAVGTGAMWLTVLITLERYLYVVFPFKSKQLVTKKNLYLVLGILLPSIAILQFVYPITRETKRNDCYLDPHNNGSKIVDSYMMVPRGGWYDTYERIHHWLTLGLVICLPLSLMILMSVVIAWRLLYRRSMLHRYNEQKRCVTRLTMSTTVVHLLLEIPSVPVFMAAAWHGPNIVNKNQFLCCYHWVASFCTTCNASMLFFIYLFFSDRFRRLFLHQMKCDLQNTNQATNLSAAAVESRSPALRRLVPNNGPVGKLERIQERSENVESGSNQEELKMLLPVPTRNGRLNSPTSLSNGVVTHL